MVHTVALVPLVLGIEQEKAFLRALIGVERTFVRTLAGDLGLTNGQTNQKQKTNFQVHDDFFL